MEASRCLTKIYGENIVLSYSPFVLKFFKDSRSSTRMLDMLGTKGIVCGFGLLRLGKLLQLSLHSSKSDIAHSWEVEITQSSIGD